MQFEDLPEFRARLKAVSRLKILKLFNEGGRARSGFLKKSALWPICNFLMAQQMAILSIKTMAFIKCCQNATRLRIVERHNVAPQ